VDNPAAVPTTATPEIAVVVASRDRPLRLRWLLNALEEQTLTRERFEVVVAHDSRGEETDELLRTHPLAADGTLTAVRIAPGTGGAGANRNAGWRAAAAPIVAFTDDDCRPPPGWLESALAAARRHPGAVVQGATRPDPEELHLERAAPHAHTRRVNPPEPWGQACNIVYPRELLERLGGFVTEPAWGGEDTDLAARARREGAGYVGAPEVLTNHAVEPMTLPAHLRSLWRWQDLPAVVKRNPELRDDLPLWIFWKRTHVWLGPALAGAALARRRRRAEWTALALPWLIHTLPQQYGTGPRGRVRALSELPARAAIDLVEVAALARGSVRWRTLFL
jgi:GT2 family glycosyltransferase